MVNLDAACMNKFIQLMEEEHTINNRIIPTIHAILVEATGYTEPVEDGHEDKLTKKQKDVLLSKRRTAKQKARQI